MTFLSILADVYNTLAFMVSILVLISCSSKDFFLFLGSTIGITHIFIFQSYFSSLARCLQMSCFYSFFHFHSLVRSYMSQSAGAVEYTDYISVQGKVSSNERPRYDTKKYDGQVPVMLEHYGMLSTSTFPSVPCPHWPGVLAPDRLLCMGQKELHCAITLN